MLSTTLSGCDVVCYRIQFLEYYTMLCVVCADFACTEEIVSISATTCPNRNSSMAYLWASAWDDV